MNKTPLTLKLLVVGLTFTILHGITLSPVEAVLSTVNIGWMFTDSSAMYPNVAGQPWRVVDGSWYHGGADYYAQDWNWGGGDAECDTHKVALSPINGYVLFNGWDTTGFGNTIVIQSSQDANYAWRGAHFSYVTESLTPGTYVAAGTTVGEIGETGLVPDENGNGPYCHLHSAFYKNLYQKYGDQLAVDYLKDGGAFSTDGGPSQFAYSPCEALKPTSIYFFSSSECIGYKRKLKTGKYNVNAIFDDRAHSIYVPQGKSIRIYSGKSGTGSKRCVTHSLWNLARDTYTDGKPIADGNGKGTISSYRVYAKPNCTK